MTSYKTGLVGAITEDGLEEEPTVVVRGVSVREVSIQAAEVSMVLALLALDGVGWVLKICASQDMSKHAQQSRNLYRLAGLHLNECDVSYIRNSRFSISDGIGESLQR